MELNPFSSEHFYWIDIGSLRYTGTSIIDVNHSFSNNIFKALGCKIRILSMPAIGYSSRQAGLQMQTGELMKKYGGGQ
jgi:hypothetical protein